VIFDCDGVLVDSEPLAALICAEMLGEMGWPDTAADVAEKYVGQANGYMVADLERRNGGPLDFNWNEQFDARYHALIPSELKEVPGIEAALDAIEGGGMRTCVASGGPHAKMQLTLGTTGLFDRLDGRIFSQDDVKRGKPAPDLVLHAAQQMGVDPARCVVIEDARPGLEGARAAGMRSFGFTGGLAKREWLAGPGTVVFDDMTALPGLLERLI